MIAAVAIDARSSDAAGGRMRRFLRSAARIATAAIFYAVLFGFALAGSAMFALPSASAYTPESPQVVELVDKGLKYLETASHREVGGQCLIALAFLKRGMPADHPKIEEAVERCRSSIAEEQANGYVYSKCIAIIFLAELDAVKHRDLINIYAAQMKEHQKEHGGFGYKSVPTGDTSQTQYAALAYWELLNHGISPDTDSVQRCLNWIMRTRDPSGVWGYQGIDPGSFALIEQYDKPGVSMAAAGMSGALILGNLVGILKPPLEANANAAGDELPDVLKRVKTVKSARAPTLPRGNVDPQRVADCVAAGDAWFDQNFTFKVHEFQSYYFYSIERFRSFQEYLDGSATEEPEWYNEGVELLKKSQGPNGAWSDNSGDECATAFSVLFLLRSTQKSIEASLGEGTLVGGRGLPRDLSKMKLRGGKLIVEYKTTEADQLMGMLEDSNSAALDDLLDNPAALSVGNVTAADARRLQQIVRSGSAGARILAVRALSQLRDVEYAPTLIFALTDPDKRVVREARDGLKSVSRRFEGYGPSDNFEDAERQAAVERWKEWYRAVRPDAPALP
jgi:hypothetical protein